MLEKTQEKQDQMCTNSRGRLLSQLSYETVRPTRGSPIFRETEKSHWRTKGSSNPRRTPDTCQLQGGSEGHTRIGNTRNPLRYGHSHPMPAMVPSSNIVVKSTNR